MRVLSEKGVRDVRKSERMSRKQKGATPVICGTEQGVANVEPCVTRNNSY
jgi:hypothetical protein